MLRTYQQDLINDCRLKLRNGERRLVCVLPTGGGKTFTFSSIVKSAYQRNRRCLILTDRIELLKQAGGSLSAFNLHPIEIKAGSKPYLGGYIYTAMVETLNRRLTKNDYKHWLNQMDIVIIDECHMRSFDKLFSYIGTNTKVLGFTATPRRIGNKNLLGDFYNDIVVGVDIPELIDGGYLCQPEYFGVQTNLEGIRTVRGDYDENQVASRFSETKLYAGVVSNWERLVKNSKTLVFSSNIESSKEIVREFIQKGYNAKHLDSNASKTERESILKWFNTNPNAILSNVGILTKGFDEPTIRTVILYRATKSLPLYLQMVGRGSRVAPSKSKFNILDFGNNITTHGFWHDKRDWNLRSTAEGVEKKLQDAVLKNCEGCEAFIPASTVVCKICGHVHLKEKKEQEIVQLQRLKPSEARKKALEGTIEEMATMVKAKVIKPHFLFHNLKSFEDVKLLVSELGYNPWWLQYNHHRFWWKDEYIKEVESGKTPIKMVG